MLFVWHQLASAEPPLTDIASMMDIDHGLLLTTTSRLATQHLQPPPKGK